MFTEYCPAVHNGHPSSQREVFISLIIPFYNEAGALAHTLQVVQQRMQALGQPWELVAINDGSRDATLAELLAARAQLPQLKVIDLSRNFGKEAALTAGLAHASGDVLIPLDADLQDPPELIPAMLEQWRLGYEVVLAKRADRSHDSLAKRLSAQWFYRCINRIAEVDIPENVGDFRLMDRVVVDALLAMPESRRFMKGLFAWVGFRTTSIDYQRPERAVGDSKFNGWRLWNLAIEGITSQSITPLRVWSYLGVLVALAAFAYAAFIVGRTLLFGVEVPGYASLITVFLFLSGLQLIGLGIMGEYLGRTYIEAKRRPAYVVRRVFDHDSRPMP